MKEALPGLFAEKTIEVTGEKTAAAVGSGSLAVFGTPAMIALMEEATCLCVAGCLEEDETTVGAEIHIHHTAPTPVGCFVTARAELVAAEGRKLTFQVTARDETQEIGGGTVTRFVVGGERFMQKAKRA